MKTAAAAYGGLAVALTVYMLVTLARSPLFPFQWHSMSWLQDWLAFSVADFYGVSLALCGIVLATEGKRGIAWSLGICLLGSPVACAYMVYKLLQGNISLQGTGYEWQT